MASCMEVNLYKNHQGVTIRLYVLGMGIIQ